MLELKIKELIERYETLAIVARKYADYGAMRAFGTVCDDLKATLKENKQQEASDA